MCRVCVFVQSLADEFYQTYNDQAFNSIEPEICHLVYVAGVESVLSSDVSLFCQRFFTNLHYHNFLVKAKIDTEIVHVRVSCEAFLRSGGQGHTCRCCCSNY